MRVCRAQFDPNEQIAFGGEDDVARVDLEVWVVDRVWRCIEA